MIQFITTQISVNFDLENPDRKLSPKFHQYLQFAFSLSVCGRAIFMYNSKYLDTILRFKILQEK